jgi:hypothetical protein
LLALHSSNSGLNSSGKDRKKDDDKKGLVVYATPEHTTLLINCFTRLQQKNDLISFLRQSSVPDPKEGKDGSSSTDTAKEYPFDVDTAIRVCFQAGFHDLAQELAQHSHRYDWFFFFFKLPYFLFS